MRFRGWFDDLRKLRQHLRIDGVGLCVLPHTFCEVTHLPGIDYNNRQRCVEQFGGKRPFITAGSFENNQCNIFVLKDFTKPAITVRCVGQMSFDDVRECCNVEGVFGDVDADVNWFRHGFVPYLQMRARSMPAAQTAVRAGPIAAVRFTLCDGLVGLGTTELSSPASFGSTRYARLTERCFNYRTFNHN